MKVDSHQHFWEINDTDYVWMGEEHARIKRDFLPQDLQPLLQAAGLDGCVAVQARQMVKETEWLLSLAEEHDFIQGVVGWVPLCENGGGADLEKWARHPKLCGVRHVVHDEPDDNFILGDDFNDGVKRLRELGLTYDILIFGKHLPQTIEFVDRHPDQPMVVDHIAKPVIEAGHFDEAWASGIRELAKREQVNCKLSGGGHRSAR
jgi:L-fuconolactonase